MRELLVGAPTLGSSLVESCPNQEADGVAARLGRRASFKAWTDATWYLYQKSHDYSVMIMGKTIINPHYCNFFPNLIRTMCIRPAFYLCVFETFAGGPERQTKKGAV